MENVQPKKRIFSGVQPSGVLTIGNYFGALKNWKPLQDEYECMFCAVDMHAITVRQTPADLRRRCVELIALYMACGIDPEKSILYVQSMVPAHAQLSWVLNCYTMFGELSRMTQFKDKSRTHADNINAGLFTYPVLMAADILVAQADLVPVGHDQLQHLELTRDVANRFNSVYGDVFTVPEAYIPKAGAKICSLADPTKKMSKSDENVNGFISMIDSKDDIIRKFKRAVTDSGSEVCRGEGKEGIGNLMNIYSCITGKTDDEIVKEFAGRGYGDFKLTVGEACAELLAGIQEKYNLYLSDKAQLDKIIIDGAEKANYITSKTVNKVYKKVGFYQPKRG